MEDCAIPERCPVFGTPFVTTAGRGYRQAQSPSLDRVIPELGYTKGNVQVISWRANTLKSDGTFPEHIRIADYIRKNTFSKPTGVL